VTYGRGFALAFVAFCAACGSSGGGGDVLGPTNEAPSLVDDAPIIGSEGPVNSATESPSENGTEAPVSNPEAPAMTGSASCLEFCNAVLATGCAEYQGTDCSVACATLEAEGEIEEEFGECADEFYGYLTCVVQSSEFACETDLEDAEFAECREGAQLFVDCADLIEQPEPEPEPQPGGDCTTDAGCVCGNDICQQCLCQTGQDQTTCASFCQ